MLRRDPAARQPQVPSFQSSRYCELVSSLAGEGLLLDLIVEFWWWWLEQ